jgi:LCP family protein required for cell wall assembly
MVGVFAYMLLPNFQTQEFDQNVVENIMDGVTTTSVSENSDSNNTNNQEENTVIESPIESEPEIKKLLNLNQTLVIKDNITSYLLIGSDKRSDESEDGYIEGQRADVIILGFFNETINKNALISIPRDTLVTNLCTGEVERINASFKRNNCGNGAENIVAAVNNLTGIKIEHIASFNFEGFEKIIDSFNGIEICVEETQREGYSFELQKGCQKVNGSTALNWTRSRNTEVLIGQKIVDEDGNDKSEWKKMEYVSDLSRVERQQYLVIQLLNELENFASFGELLQFIQALEETFVVDEGLSINKATNILWGLRTLDLNNISKLTMPTTPYQLNDGRQVLILNGNFYDFAKENLLIEE